jgi:hypothetical protein
MACCNRRKRDVKELVLLFQPMSDETEEDIKCLSV